MTKKKIAVLGIVLAALVVISGVSIIAATNAGTQSDPLIALSYLMDKYTPDLMNKVGEKILAAELSFEAKYNEVMQKINQLSGGSGVATTDVFSVVTLSNGQTVTCEVGAEIMLRIGTAKAAGSSYPALVDTTSGSSLSAGVALTVNHLYMVTIRQNGVTATDDTVKILIRGDYTIG
jgi:hypothetical protein